MAHIPTTKAPNLTPPAPEYNREQLLQMYNQLRLYFNQIDATTLHQIDHVGSLESLQWLGDL